MRSNRLLAGALVLVTVLLAAAGELLVLRHVGDWLGLALLAAAVGAAVAAWLALGAPVTRRQIGPGRIDPGRSDS
jgi:hypothetical protein